MDYLCAKFGDFSFSRMVLPCGQTDKLIELIILGSAGITGHYKQFTVTESDFIVRISGGL